MKTKSLPAPPSLLVGANEKAEETAAKRKTKKKDADI